MFLLLLLRQGLIGCPCSGASETSKGSMLKVASLQIDQTPTDQELGESKGQSDLAKKEPRWTYSRQVSAGDETLNVTVATRGEISLNPPSTLAQIMNCAAAFDSSPTISAPPIILYMTVVVWGYSPWKVTIDRVLQGREGIRLLRELECTGQVLKHVFGICVSRSASQISIESMLRLVAKFTSCEH